MHCRVYVLIMFVQEINDLKKYIKFHQKLKYFCFVFWQEIIYIWYEFMQFWQEFMQIWQEIMYFWQEFIQKIIIFLLVGNYALLVGLYAFLVGNYALLVGNYACLVGIYVEKGMRSCQLTRGEKIDKIQRLTHHQYSFCQKRRF